MLWGQNSTVGGIYIQFLLSPGVLLARCEFDKCVAVLSRALLCGLVAAAAAAGTMLGADIAGAASKRRPPPPAPAEAKKDPNVSGVQAKVLASRKRKEAMKEAVAKLREKGKPVDK